MVEHHLEINHVMQILFIFNESDASSIKYKDVKTNTSGQYSTTDNISILNVVSLSYDPFNIFNYFIFYAIHYEKKSNTTTVACYNVSSYVDHKYLNDYLDSHRDDNVTILAYQNIAESIDIRLYYI